MGIQKNLRKARRLRQQVEAEIAERLANQKKLIKEDLMREWRERKKKKEEAEKNDSLSKNQE